MAKRDQQPAYASFMRRQAVAFELGITRHTLARLIKHDLTFPSFFAISPGIEVIDRKDFDQWVRRKRQQARLAKVVAPSEPESTNNNPG